MTKKHLEVVARTIKANRDGSCDLKSEVVVNRIVTELCAAFAQENPRFNIEKFVEACK